MCFEPHALTGELVPEGMKPALRRYLPMDLPRAFVLIALTAACGASAAQRISRVMVAEVKAEKGIEEKIARFTGYALAQELRKYERMQVVSSSELDEMLSFEEEKRLMGCTEEVCLTEIVAAMGVDEMITASLMETPGSRVLRISRMDVTTATTVGSVTRQLEKFKAQRHGEEFLSAIGPAVQELYPEALLRPGQSRGVTAELARQLNPPPLKRWVPIVTSSAAALSCALGGLAYMDMKNVEGDYNRLVEQSVTSGPVSGAQLASLEKQAWQRADQATVLFAVAGGLALATGVVSLFVDWQDTPGLPPANNTVRLSPAVGPQGAGMLFSMDLP